MDEKIKVRAKLIYERDNNSPLFLRTADLYLKNNNPYDAISILEKGLIEFPDHPLAYILLGKAHYSLGSIEQSESFFRKASDILNSHRTFEYYKHEFKLPNKQTLPFDSSRGNIFINSSDDYVNDEEVEDDQPKSVEENLKQIAEKLMNTRINQNNDISLNKYSQQEFKAYNNKLASETLANIYLSQGNKNEAIKVYELLIHRSPERKEYYLEKIRELKSQ